MTVISSSSSSSSSSNRVKRSVDYNIHRLKDEASTTIRKRPEHIRHYLLCRYIVPLIVTFLLFIVARIFLPIIGFNEKKQHNIKQNPHDFEKVKDLLEAVGNLIHQRYELQQQEQRQLFLVSWNLPSHGWDILKYKVARKTLESIQASNNKSTFLMVFGGSSVTAGYDNYFNQSYPSIIQSRLYPIFYELGIELIVRNIGQMHVDCRLHNYCFEAAAGGAAIGEEIDVVGWENSFDCAKDQDVHEFAARIAGWNQALIHYSASGGFSLDGCQVSKESIPRIDDRWTPSVHDFSLSSESVSQRRAELNDWYYDGEVTITKLGRGVGSVAKFTAALDLRNRKEQLDDDGTPSPVEDGRSFLDVAKMAAFGGESYAGVAAHGFSVWGSSKSLCKREKVKKIADTSNMDGVSNLEYNGNVDNISHAISVVSQPGSKHSSLSSTVRGKRRRRQLNNEQNVQEAELVLQALRDELRSRNEEARSRPNRGQQQAIKLQTRARNRAKQSQLLRSNPSVRDNAALRIKGSRYKPLPIRPADKAINRKKQSHINSDSSIIPSVPTVNIENNLIGCTGDMMKGACFENGGPRWRTADAAIFGKPGGQGKIWHPSLGMHMLRAEMLVYNYIQIIYDAIIMIESNLKRMSLNDIITEYKIKFQELQKPIPKIPYHCNQNECSKMPLCFTDYQPHYNPLRQLNRLILGKHSGWQRDEILPHSDVQLLNLLDRKICYKGSGNKQEIYIQLLGINTGTIYIYGHPKYRNSLRDVLFFLDPFLRSNSSNEIFHSIYSTHHSSSTASSSSSASSLDNNNHNKINIIQQTYQPTQWRYQLQDIASSETKNFIRLDNLPPGDHVLTIMTDRMDPRAIAGFCHIVIF